MEPQDREPVTDEKQPVGCEHLASLRELLAEEPPGAFERFIEYYLRASESSLTSLRAALEAGDASAAELAAHALKGSSGNVGADRLVGLCRGIEQAARGGRLQELAPEVAAAESEFMRVRDVLSQEVRREEAR